MEEEEGKLKVREQPNSDKFKATNLWYSIIEHLRCNVTQKTHRYFLRKWDGCFSGSNAVDSVLRFLQSDASHFIKNEITRDNATKVCQALLNCNVFKPIPNRRFKAPEPTCKFEDNPSKLYHFLPSKEISPPLRSFQSVLRQNYGNTEDNFRLLNLHQNDCCADGSVVINHYALNECESFDDISEESLNNEGHFFQRSRTYFKPQLDKRRLSFASGSIDGHSVASFENNENHFQRKFTSVRLRSSYRKKLVVTKPKVPSLNVTTQDSQYAMREAALARLLVILDIPVLENILTAISLLPLEISCVNNIAESLQSSRFWQQNKINIINEKWLHEIYCILKAETVSSSRLMQCFFNTVDCFRHRKHCVIPQYLRDVFISILPLIRNNKYELTLEAFQLTIVLLPQFLRFKLYCLLKFMILVSEVTDVRINEKVTNKDAVIEKLGCVILDFALVSEEFLCLLVTFMVDHVDIICNTPKSLLSSFNGVSACRQQTPEPTFCHRISPKEYEEQRKHWREEGLRDLMNNVIDSAALPLKKKKKWIFRFQRFHPTLFKKYYEGDL